MRLAKVSEAFDRSGFPPGMPIPDIVKALNYRTETFGTPLSVAQEDVMRGPSEWNVGERELIAAYVSHQNRCPFCVGVHSAVASIALDDSEPVAVMLDDLESAPISARLRAVCRLLAVLTRTPEAVEPHDVDAAREAGASDQAILDAIHIAALFNMINRCSNALGFELMDEDSPPGGSHPLLDYGYTGSIG